MIAKPTVLILGAGASAPYGFPTGRTLLLRICEQLSQQNSELTNHMRACDFDLAAISKFQEALEGSMRPSVDAFLENRSEFMEIGKAAIAASLIPCEKPAILTKRSLDEQWYEYLFNKMATPKACDFGKNRLAFVTFNYDRSLEYFLWSALQKTYGLTPAEAFELRNHISIVHVYGQLGRLGEGPGSRYYSYLVEREKIKTSVDSMKIMHEGTDSSPEFVTAHGLLENAQTVCFLGFGYHEVNVRRLGLNNRPSPPTLYGTAYGLMDNEQGRVRQLFPNQISLAHESLDVLACLRKMPVLG